MLASFAACLQPNQTNAICKRNLWVHHVQDRSLCDKAHAIWAYLHP